MIIQLYIGYFGRAPDPAGYTHYLDDLKNNGRSIEDIAREFAGSDEAKAKYPYLAYPDLLTDASNFVDSIYMNLFNRSPAADDTYWKDQLESGDITADVFILNIINGAAPDSEDANSVANKVAAARDFTIGVALAGLPWTANLAEASSEVIGGVDGSDAPDSWADAIAGQIAEASGERFKLTDGDDPVLGTSGNDKISGVIGKSSDRTLDRGDSIDGGAGEDTLEVYATANVTIPGGLDIDNVEIVRIIDDGDSGANVEVSGIDSSKFGSAVEQLWQQGGTARNVEVAAGVTAGFDSTAFMNPVTVTTKAEAISVVLENVAAENRPDDGDEDTSEANDAVSLVLAASNATTATVTGSFADLTHTRDYDTDNPGVDSISATTSRFELDVSGLKEKSTLNLNLTGPSKDGDVVIVDINGIENLQKIDASESTGNFLFITIPNYDAAIESGDQDVGGLTDGFMFMGGAGNDVFDAGEVPATVDITLMGGAGDDTLNGGAGEDDLNGGTGADTYVIMQGDSSVGAADTINFDVAATGGDTLQLDIKADEDNFHRVSRSDTQYTGYSDGEFLNLAEGEFRSDDDHMFVFIHNEGGNSARLYIDRDGDNRADEMIEFVGSSGLAGFDHGDISVAGA